MNVKWRNCREADREHADNERQYAHTYHYAGTICLAKAFWDLPKPYRDGILLHEIGHLLAGPEGSEREATEAAEDFFDAQIAYVDSPYGAELERLSNMARRVTLKRRRRNQGGLAYNEWIPTHGVMFHQDGTVSLMTEGTTANRGRRRNPMTDAETYELEGAIKQEIRTRAPEWKHLSLNNALNEAELLIDRMGGSRLTGESRDALNHFAQTQIRLQGMNRGRRRNATYGRRGELEFIPERLKADLMNLWHLSRTAEGSNEGARIDWTVDEFHKEHPEFSHSHIFRDLNALL